MRVRRVSEGAARGGDGRDVIDWLSVNGFLLLLVWGLAGIAVGGAVILCIRSTYQDWTRNPSEGDPGARG